MKVVGPNQLAYADFRGNTQLISVGNVSKNDRCSLILMDYPNRRRLKLLGRITEIADSDLQTLAELEVADYRAVVERGFLIRVGIPHFEENDDTRAI